MRETYLKIQIQRHWCVGKEITQKEHSRPQDEKTKVGTQRKERQTLSFVKEQ